MAHRRKRTSVSIIEDASILEYLDGLYVQRPMFSSLFYAALNAESERAFLSSRLDTLRGRAVSKDSIEYGLAREHDELESDVLAYGTSAEDAASALVLLCDAALRRLHSEQTGDVSFGHDSFEAIDVRECGDIAFNGAKFSAGIWALANRTRHIDLWRKYDSAKLTTISDFAVIDGLGIAPLEDNASIMFIDKLGFKAYRAFEDRLLSIGIDLMERRYGGAKRLTVHLLKSHTVAIINEPARPKDS
jgi:hypothetical protein